MYDGLPEACLTLMPSDGRLIYIERGQSGYNTSNWDTSDPVQNRRIADDYNEKLGVTKAQEEAMLNGSMFGWDVPAANPKHYENLPPQEVNASYAIIQRIAIGGIEIVLGQHVKRPEMYVTWRRTPANERNAKPEYYWGHYFGNEQSAVADFNSRVENEKLDANDYAQERFKPEPPKRAGHER
jgi:hypothetical protein